MAIDKKIRQLDLLVSASRAARLAVAETDNKTYGYELGSLIDEVTLQVTGSLFDALTGSVLAYVFDSGSLLQTGSVSGNVLTFTKGDSSTFNLTVETGSIDYISNITYSTDAGTITFTGTGNAHDGSIAISSITASSLVSASLNGTQFVYYKGDGSTLSFLFNTSSFLTAEDTASFVTNSDTGSFLTSMSYNPTTGIMTGVSPDTTYTPNLNSLIVSASIKDQTLAKTNTISRLNFEGNAVTASFAGGVFDVTINTGSLPSLDPFPYNGKVEVTGSIEATGSIHSTLGSAKFQLGRDQYLKVKNTSGLNIFYGVPAYISGAQDGLPLVYQATPSIPTSSHPPHVIGVAAESILTGNEGYLLLKGYLRNYNTFLWNSGSKVYLPVGGGQLSGTPPSSPYEVTKIGTVLESDFNNGVIYVDIEPPIDSVYQATTASYALNAANAVIDTGSFLDSGSFNTSTSVLTLYSPDTNYTIDLSSLIFAGATQLTASDEGNVIATIISQFDFRGNGIQATVTGSKVTVSSNTGSNAVSSSHASFATTASYALNTPITTGSFINSGSYNSSTNTVTLYSPDANYSLDLSGLAFPFTGSAGVLGSVNVNGTISTTGDTTVGGALYAEGQISASNHITLNNDLDIRWYSTAGNINSILTLNNNDTIVIGSPSGNITGSYFGVSGSYYLRALANGKHLGVWTTNPQFALDVSGDARVTNGLDLTGSLQQLNGNVISTGYFESIGTTLLRDNKNNNLFTYSSDGVLSNRALTLGNATYKYINLSMGGAGFVYITGSLFASQSIEAQGGFVGDLTGTSSYAVTSSYVLTSSFALTAASAVTASYTVSSSYALSSSHALTASYVEGYLSSEDTGSFAVNIDVPSDARINWTAGNGDVTSYEINNVTSSISSSLATTASYALDYQDYFPTSIAALKSYSGPRNTAFLNTTYVNDLPETGSGVTVSASIMYVYSPIALSNGGNDLTRVNSTGKGGHWRAISTTPSLVFNYASNTGSGVTNISSSLFIDLTIYDLKIYSENQNLDFELDSITNGILGLQDSLYGALKIQLL